MLARPATSFTGLGGNDTIDAGENDAEIIVGATPPGDDNAVAHDDVVDGGPGDGWVDGGAGFGLLRGGTGRHVLRGWPGSDRMRAGTGQDVCHNPSSGPGFRGCYRVRHAQTSQTVAKRAQPPLPWTRRRPPVRHHVGELHL
jgi:Ca2+-binding RTX toxin-like protein